VLVVLARHHAALLHQEGVAGPRARQLGMDDFLGLAVGLADIVAGALQGNLQVLDLAEVARQRAPGLHRCLHHDVEDRRTRHRSASGRLLSRHGGHR